MVNTSYLGKEKILYANAGCLFVNAVDFCKAVSSLNPASERAQRESRASIVFAALSTEVFINELAKLAADAAKASPEPSWVEVLSEVLNNAEESHAATKSKYHLAKLVLANQVFTKGAPPFQNFAFLVDLRNRIMHAKPEKLEAVRYKEADGQWVWEDNIMSGLAQRGVVTTDNILSHFIPEDEPATIQSNLLAEISTQGVGRWACQAAAGIVNAVLDTLPSSPRFTPMVENIYRKDFQIPDDL